MMKRLISIIITLCIIFTTTSVFSEAKVYDRGCEYIQTKIINNVLTAERVGQRRKMNGSSIIAASQMTMFWLELFKMRGCSNILLDTSANIDTLTNGLIKAMED